MVSVLIRLLALIGLLWTGKQVTHQVASAMRPGERTHDDGADAGPDDEMVRDPACQTYVPKALAVQKTIAGERVYFCSHACATQFLAQHRARAQHREGAES